MTSPNISIGNASVFEGGQLQFAVTLNTVATQNITLHYATFTGTASGADNDYAGTVDSTIVIPAGQSGGTITVQTIQDSKVEPDETMSVHLLSTSFGTIVQGIGAGTIRNDDVVVTPPNISVGNASVVEGGQLQFAVTLDRAATQNITLHYATFTGTASGADNDYAGTVDSTLVIAAGQSGGTITVQTIQDSKVEPDETMSVHLLSTSFGTIVQGIGAGTILNDDVVVTPPNISIGNASVVEGGTLQFSVTLDRAATQNITLHYATFFGTANNGDNDYTGTVDSTIVIPAGQTGGTITVQTIQDSKVEPDETMSVHLLSTSFGNIVQGIGAGTILNDDVAVTPPNISIGNASVVEGGQLQFAVTLDRAATQNVTLHYATYFGTASHADNDYTGTVDSTLVIAAGQSGGTITVQTTPDSKVEPDETMSVHLLSTSFGNIVQGIGAGTIVNDDVAVTSPNISIGTASVVEGGQLQFAVTLDRAATQDVTLHYATYFGTASHADNDYTGTVDSTLVIAAGQSGGTITVQTTPDSKVEPDETMSVHLLSTSFGNILQGIGAGTILNDDVVATQPNISIGTASVVEGGQLQFAVTLDRAATQDVTLHYATYFGTASHADNDYTGTVDSTLVIAAGQSGGTITVQTTPDSKVEPDETMSVHLLSTSFGNIVQGIGAGTIVNDDVAVTSPNISIGTASVVEGGQLQFGVTLDRAATQDVTLHYATFFGTASHADNDYTGTVDSTIVIPTGQSSGTITVQTIQDSKVEPDETMSVHLLSTSFGNIVQGIGAGTILNDDVDNAHFNITFAYNSAALQTNAIVSAFESAANRWAQIITADLPNLTDLTYGNIDDLLISVSSRTIDGAGNTLAQATWDQDKLRAESHIPYHAFMYIDEADLATIGDSNILVDVITHEIGHALGLTQAMWSNEGLTVPLGLLDFIHPAPFKYIGEHALAYYRLYAGDSLAPYVPIETEGGAGTYGSHWSEQIFGKELMTGWFGDNITQDDTGPLPISRVTIGALQDLGYTVDPLKADPYALPDPARAPANVAAVPPNVLLGEGVAALMGGAGNNHFVYTALNDGIDHIVDFASGDLFDFSRIAFGNNLGVGGTNTGALDLAHFVANSTGPTNTAQVFWYNTATSTLNYDPDGSGFLALPTAIAVLDNQFNLHNTDIHLI